MEKKRYNIGLVVGNVEDDFSNAVCKGAIQAAEELDDNLFIIPVKYLDYYMSDEPLQAYEYQYNTLLSYAQVSSLDIVLLCLSTIGTTTTRERCLEVLSQFRDIPTILIASHEEGFSCILYANDSGLSEGIRHLITVENRKCIGMISGVLSNQDAEERLATYRKLIEEYHLPNGDSLVKYSDFKSRCANAVEEMLAENPTLDAIVCCNDSMAKTVYEVLDAHGIAIGEEISVIGFDDIEQAKLLTPPLATVRADASELGFRAVLQGHRKLKSDTTFEPETYYVDTKFIYRESIGVHSEKRLLMQKQQDEQNHLFEKAQLSEANRRLINMNHSMNILSRDMLMLEDEQEQSYLRILHCLTDAQIRNCYLFTLNVPIASYPLKPWKQPDSVYLRAYLKDGIPCVLARTKQKIHTQDIYRNGFLPDTRNTYLMIDLYSREMQYGFLLCDMEFENYHYSEFLCYQVSIALKLMHMFEDKRALLMEKDDLLRRLQKENLMLDSISGKDELTGILNRRGFYKKARPFIDEAAQAHKPVLFAYADLNYLKQINDRYGHAEGDFALSVSAHALETVFRGGIVGRIGGDEFAALAVGTESLQEDDIRAALDELLLQVSKEAGKPYPVRLSIGIWTPPDNRHFELNEAIEMADALLYEAKKNKPPFTPVNQ